MIRTYIVTYDICDPKRLRRVFNTMKSYGDHLQLSVFQCDLNASQVVRMRAALEAIVKRDEDQVLIIDLGSLSGRFRDRIVAIGLPYVHERPDAFIV